METVEFLKAYGVYILSALSIIIEVFILFCKKRPKTLDDFLDCIRQCETLLPSFISEVEVDGNGSLKKAQVISRSKCNAKHILGRSLSDTEEKIFVSSMSEQIEKILSTPQKKEK